MNEFRAVKQFMRACGQATPPTPQIPSLDSVKLRIRLVEEETAELLRDLYWVEYWLEKHPNVPLPQDIKLRVLTAVADDVADVNYVVNGTGVAFGLDGETSFEIVHSANMQKTTGPRRPDGKQLKPPGWQPPEPALADMIVSQWTSYVPTVPQIAGVEWEGPQS